MTLAMAMTTTLLAGQITPQEAARIKAENPLVQEWNTPFQTPPFDSIRTEDYEPAILYAIEEAKKEAIENILDVAWLKKNRDLKGIVVTGCLPQRYREEILKELPEIDAVLGTGSIDDICTAVNSAYKRGTQKFTSFKVSLMTWALFATFGLRLSISGIFKPCHDIFKLIGLVIFK